MAITGVGLTLRNQTVFKSALLSFNWLKVGANEISLLVVVYQTNNNNSLVVELSIIYKLYETKKES